MEKYRLIESDIEGLYRVQALKNFSDVKEGEIGGYVEKERNLSQGGDCWIYNNAKVYGNARVYDDAKVYDCSEIYENAHIRDYAIIHGDSKIHSEACVYLKAEIHGGNHIGEIRMNYDKIIHIQCSKRVLTLYKDDGEIFFNIGCQMGISKDKFIDRIYKNGGLEANPYRQEYLNIIEAADILLR